MRTIFALTGLMLFGGVATASAQEITVTAGGGFEDYAGETMRRTSTSTGMWAVRAAVEVQRYVALEAGYLGSAAELATPLGTEDAMLVGTTLQAAVRVMPVPGEGVQPYAFAGAAWRRYDVTGADMTLADSGMNDSDDLLQIPFGLGVENRYGRIVADLRVSFRPTIGGGLVLEADGDYAPMSSWGIDVALGYQL